MMTTHSAASATPWTLTSLLEYYTKTFIDAIVKLSTHRLNQGLTVSTPLLVFCHAWSLNEYVMLLTYFFYFLLLQ